MARARYDREGIENTLWKHSVLATDLAPGSFRYHGQRHGRFVMVVHGELLELTEREAWVVCYALRAGRDLGRALAEHPEEDDECPPTTM